MCSKSYKRPIDVKRDIILFFNLISLNNYLLYCSKLFRYDISHQKIVLSDIYQILDKILPVDMYDIQMNSFECIKNYLQLNMAFWICRFSLLFHPPIFYFYPRSSFISNPLTISVCFCSFVTDRSHFFADVRKILQAKFRFRSVTK